MLFDLDCVIRLWDNENDHRDEQIAHLPAGTIAAVAFSSDLLLPALTGHITDEQWRANIITTLEDRFPQSPIADAIVQLSAYPGRVNTSMFALAQKYRQYIPVYLLTNATSRLLDDLQMLGIANAFNDVFNSAKIGYAKPSQEIFQSVLATLRLPAEEILYIDDDFNFVRAAMALGFSAIHHHDIEETRKAMEVAIGY